MSIIFEPIRINQIELKNRLVRSATAERRVDKDGAVTDDLVKFYERLARGGVGTIITGHAYIREDGRSGWQMMGIHNNNLIPGLKRLSRETHKYDARIFVQINHVGRYAPGGIIQTNPLAPSIIDEDDRKGVYPPREMTSNDIKEIIQAFGRAAARAQEAGFDGVQIHAAHGYLVNQFLSPRTNKRTDEWGGSTENRARFLLEIIREIRAKVGPDFPAWVKINCEDFIKDGLSLEESLTVAEKLNQQACLPEAGINAIEISGGVQFETVIRLEVGKKEPEAYFLPQAEEFRKRLDTPLILVGGIRRLETIEMLVKEKGMDLVSMSRPLIREPDLPLKFQKKLTDQATCISCNRCLGRKIQPVICRVDEKVRLRVKLK